MRAMRAAHSMRSFPMLGRALIAPSRSARALPRLVSTEAAAGSGASANFIKEMMPTASFLGILASLTSVGVLFYSRITKLEADMLGVAATLKSDMAGTAGKLEERVAGIIKEVDAKNTGTKDAVDAKIVGFKEAADLKVRFLLRARARMIDPLSHAPPPPPLQYKAK
jgi:hypothetical protein